MFNRLEEIAVQSQPCTPILKFRITSALQPRNFENKSEVKQTHSEGTRPPRLTQGPCLVFDESDQLGGSVISSRLPSSHACRHA